MFLRGPPRAVIENLTIAFGREHGREWITHRPQEFRACGVGNGGVFPDKAVESTGDGRTHSPRWKLTGPFGHDAGK